MGENGPPPLSRRVPGTTSMPKAHGRRPPPKLPDGVLERLQAEVLAARAKQAAELEASDPGQSEEASLPEPSPGGLAKRSKLTAFSKRSNAAPLPDEPLAAPLRQEPECAPPPEQAKPAPFPQRPQVAPRIERPKLAPLRQEPTAAPFPVPQKADSIPERSKVAAPPLWPAVAPQSRTRNDETLEAKEVDWEVLPDSPRSPVADSDDITEPIPVVAPSRTGTRGTARSIRDLVNDQSAPAAPARSRRPASPKAPRRSQSPASPKAPRRSQNPATPKAPRRSQSPATLKTPPRSQRPARPKLAPRLVSRQSELGNQAPKLGALFAEASSFEEVVASARAQAGSRVPVVEWRYVIAAACLAALILVAVAVFVLQLAQ